MAQLYRHLICLLLALVASGWAGAAQSGAGALQPPVRFTVFSVKPIAGLEFVPRSGTPAQKLAFYATARSPRYEYRGAMPLRFTDASGVVVAEAVIPPEIRDALLLFSPLEKEGGAGAAKSTLRYQIAVLDDGAARHNAGGLAIINLSGLALSGSINKQAVNLRAGLNPTIAMGRTAAMTLRTTANQRTYQAYATTVTLGTKQRALLILFPPATKGSWEVQSRLLLDEPPARPVN